MISLIITIIVLIILALIFFVTSSTMPGEATYAKFAAEINNVQSGVYDARIRNAQFGDTEEKINNGFTKVTLVNAPEEFESFDFTGASVTGYLIGLNKIRYENAEFGHEFDKEEVTPLQELTFDETDAYVYDAAGLVYYVKGLDYNGTRVYSLANIADAGMTSTEDGPIITNVIVTKGTLDDGTETSSKAKIIISAFPRYGGELTVMVRNNVADKQEDGTYATQVSRNGTYTIIVTEKNGGRTVTKVTVTGIIESTTPPTNLSMVINNGEPFTTENMADVVVRADGAVKMLIAKNNPVRPNVNSSGWEEYKENFEYDLKNEGKITLYAWFMDEFYNITDTIVKATVTYDKTPPSDTMPDVIQEVGDKLLIKCNQTDNISKDLKIEYGFKKYDGTQSYEEDYTWSDNSLIGPLDNRTQYEIVTRATDEAGNYRVSKPKIHTVNHTYIIEFNTLGGEGEFEHLTGHQDEAIRIPSEYVSTKQGYNFIGWSVISGDKENVIKVGDTYTPIGTNLLITLYAVWEARTDTPYTVHYYFERLNAPGEYVENPAGGVKLYGETDKWAIAPGDFVGFERNDSHPESVTNERIKGDGSTVLKLFFNRCKYTLTIIAENGGTATESKTNVPFESEVSIVATPNNGFKFEGWEIDGLDDESNELYENFIGTNGNKASNATFKMPAQDITLIAKFGLIDYDIEYVLKNGIYVDGKTNPESYNKLTEAFTLNNPVKNGYEFIGWTGEWEGSTLVAPELNVTIDPSTIENMTDRKYIANYVATEGLLTITPDKTGEAVSAPVTITINCLDGNLKVQYKIGENGGWQDYTGPFTIDKNTTIYARGLEDGEEIITAELTISNIDGEEPIIEKVEVSKDWRPGYTLSFDITATDDIGVASYAITDDASKPADDEFDVNSGDIEIATDGKNYVWVKDKAGNTVSKEIYAWDISENGDESVYAVIIDGTLRIVGNGATKAYTEDEVPYKDLKNSIKEIIVEEGVTKLNDGIISSMPLVTTISFPESLREITEDAFIYTNNYTNIDIPASNEYFVYEKFTLFDKDKTTIYSHSKADTTSVYTVDSTVTEIRKLAFYDNDNLKKVVVSSNPELGDGAFKESSNLFEIAGQIGGTSIGKEALADCTSLETITISDTIETIGEKAFYNTTMLSTLTIPKSIKEIGKDANEVFVNIGTNSSNAEGKGIVRYYQSSREMHAYAMAYSDEAIFQMIDDMEASLLGLEITSPATGTYPAGTKVTFVATFDEPIDSTKGVLPELIIKVGNGENTVVTDVKVNGNEVVYTYTAKDTDEGLVTFVSYKGQVYDMVGNDADIETSEITGSEITITTFIKLEEGINTYYFVKLQDAIDKASSMPETPSKITLLKDVTESVVVISGKDIELYLNNKTLTADDNAAAIMNSGFLSIKDAGKVTSASKSTIENLTSAVFVINNAVIENTSTEDVNAIFNSDGGNVELNNATVSAVGEGIENNGQLIISDSEITSETSSAIINNSGALSSIKGGSITLGENVNGENAGIVNAENSTLYIDGLSINANNVTGIKNNGTVEIKNDTAILTTGTAYENNTSGKTIIYNASMSSTSQTLDTIVNKGTLEIKNGTFTSKYANVVSNEAGSMTISGGTIKSEGTGAAIENKQDVNMLITAGTILANSAQGINNDGLLTIEGNTLVNSDSGYGIYNGTSANLEITSATVASSGDAAIVNDGTANLKGAEIISTGEMGINTKSNSSLDVQDTSIKVQRENGNVIGIYTASNNTVIENSEIAASTANGDAKGIELNGGKTIVEITSVIATGTSNGYGILNNNGEITVGKNDDTLDKTIPSFEGSTYGYYSDNGTLNMYDGKFVGNVDCSLVGEVAGKPEDSFIRRTVEDLRETAVLIVDYDAPTNIILVASTSEWTREPITVSGEATDDNSGIVAYAFTKTNAEPLDSEWTTLDEIETHIVITKEYAETTSLYFWVKDYVGNTGVSNKVELKYDIEAPNITSVTKDPEGWTTGSVKLTISAEDNLSGIAGYAVVDTYVEPSEFTDYIDIVPTSTFTVTVNEANGIKYIYVKDKAGNVKYMSYEINNIDTVPPTIEVDVEEYRGDRTTIKIYATDNESGVASVKVNQTQINILDSATRLNTKEATYDISSAGTFEIIATDEVGLETSVVINSYIISYVANGGTGVMKSQIKIQDFDIELLENAFENIGFTFNNWNTKADGTGTTYNPGDKYTENANVILYAMWNDMQSPVILDVTLSPNFVAGSDIMLRITAEDNKGVTGYAITTTNSEPTSWSESSDVTVTAGDGTYYVWVKDADGNTTMTEIKLYDISETPNGKEVVAIVKGDPENANKQTLSIEGTGATGDYTAETLPWKDVAEEITNVEIKSGVTSLGEQVLSNLPNVDQIVISDTVTDIAIDTFIHTNNYEDIVIAGDNFVYENGMLFDEAKETLYVASTSETKGKVVLPETIKEIAPYAFENSKITEIIIIPNINIAEGTFKNAESLTKITSADGIGGTSIGTSAFEGCTNLESIDLSDNLENLGDRAFYDCTDLTDITISKTLETIGGDEVFTNIGINAGTETGKGVVYYYDSCEAMAKYATDEATKDQATFIAIDDILPVVEEFTINNGDEVAPTRKVMLQIKATDNREVVSMIITDNAAFVPNKNSREWITYAEEYEYTLSVANGEKELFVWVKDSSGNISAAPPASDKITLAQMTFEMLGAEEVVQYVDLTGKDYYEYRDAGYEEPDEGFSITVTNPVNHEQEGTYEVKYTLLFEGEYVDEYGRIVDIIANSWQTEVKTDGDYSFVLHTSGNYAKIVGYDNTNSVTELELPSVFTVNGTEYKVIDVGNGTTGIASNGTETRIEKVTLPDTVIAVSDYAFSNFVELENVVYGDSLMTIGKYAFTNSNGTYNDLLVNDNVREVKEGAFYNTRVNELIIEDGVKSIESNAFRNIETSRSVATFIEIPASVDNISEGAFARMLVGELIVSATNTKYKAVDSGKGLMSADGTLFLQYATSNAATEYQIPNGTVTIGAGAFEGATNLTKVTFSESVTAINAYAFSETKLSDVKVLENVTNIGEKAFANIDTLEKVVIEGIPEITGDVFANSNSLTYLVLLDNQNMVTVNGASIEVGTDGTVYVATPELEEDYEADSIWGTLGESRIKCIYELIGDAEINLNHGSTYVEEGIKLLDEELKTGSGESAIVSGLAAAYSSNVNTNVVGTYEVTYTITYNGETVGTLTRKVNIEDTTPAEIKDIVTSDDWVPGEDLEVKVEAEDDYGETTLEYAVTPTPDSGDAEWTTDPNLPLDEGDNYIHVKDDSGNVTTEVIKVWDISKNGDKTVFAYLTEDGELTITGSGETKDITEGNAPWKDETITKITIEEGVTSLGEYILSDLENVTEITIPASLGETPIAENAFAGTNNFDKITVDPSNEYLEALDDYTLATESGDIIYVHSSKDPDTTFDVPSTVEKIAESAFENNENLTEVTLNSKVDLGDEAFAGCTNLETIEGEIGDKVIGTEAFSGDVNLKDITISKTVEELGTDVFENVPGPVYYYASCDAMVEYVEANEGETDFRLIDDVPPTTDAPTLKASSSTIVATSNQKDEHSEIVKVEYIIRASGDVYDENAWQSEYYFLGLEAEKVYFVKTRVEDAKGNKAESEEASIKTEKVPDEIYITANPTTPTSGDVVVTVEWPQTKIDELYGGDWPTGTNVTKQIGIQKSGEANPTWQDITGNDATSTITVTENNVTVYARLFDGTNYTGAVSLNVGNIDRVAPTGSVVINNGEEGTIDRNVKLTLTAVDDRTDEGYGVKYYFASESAVTPSVDLTTGWKEFQGDGEYDFELSYAREVKTVYVWFMDTAFNMSVAYSDTIELYANTAKLEENGETTYYDTLIAAFEAASKLEPAIASRITLLKDIEGEGTVKVTGSQNIVLDMGGFNIIHTATDTTIGIENKGLLRIENSETSVETSISITTTSGDAYGIYNEGYLEVDSVSVTADAPDVAIAIYNVEPTPAKKAVRKPTLSGDLVFNGQEQDVVLEGFDETIMEIDGGKVTNAGEYTAIVSLLNPDRYVWSDGTSENFGIDFEVKDAWLADVVEVGDYVSYPVEYENVGVTGITTGNTYQSTLEGWRVISIEEDGTVNLVSAGVPLTYYYNADTQEESIEALTTNFLDTTYGKTNGFGENVSLTEIFANKYTTTVDGIIPKVRAINEEDILGVIGGSIEDRMIIPDGEYGDLFKNGSVYYLASAPAINPTNLWYVNGIESRIYGINNVEYGIRPVVTLKSTVRTSAVDENGEFNMTIADPVILLDVVELGEYVKYPIEYDNVVTYKDENGNEYVSTNEGWQVLGIENDSVNIVTAGVPMTYNHVSGTSSESVNNLTNNFMTTEFATNESESGNKYISTGFDSEKTLAEIFANGYTKVEGAELIPVVSTITKEDILALTGASELVAGKGLTNDKGVLETGAPYYLASVYENDSSLWSVDADGILGYSANELGIRPVVGVKSTIMTTGKNRIGEWDVEIERTNAITTVEAPTVSGDITVVYDGTEKGIELKGFNSRLMEITGTQNATEAGEYTFTISLKEPSRYKWSDGTTTPKTITWSIEKATTTLEVTPENGNVDYNATNTFTVTSSVDGTITVTSGGPNVSITEGNGASLLKDVSSIVTYKGVAGTTETTTITVVFTPTDTVNYKSVTKQFTVSSVERIENIIKVTGKTLIYAGEAQELVSATDEQGDVYYAIGTALTAENYETAGNMEIPTAKDAGTYEIYYYTLGNENYEAASGSVQTEIKKAEIGLIVNIAGNNIFAQCLTAEYSISPAHIVPKFQWYYNDENTTYGGTPIDGASGESYTIGDGLIGKYIYVTVTAEDENYVTKTVSDITDEENNGSAVVERIILKKPTRNGVNMFTGKEQTVMLADYDSSVMDMTGGIGTEEQSYTATITLKDNKNYAWKDLTTDAVIIPWEIVESTVYVTLYTDGTLGFSNNTDTIRGKTVSKSYGNIAKLNYETTEAQSAAPWSGDRASIFTVNFVNTCTPYYTTAGWFNNCTKLTVIKNLENLNTYNVTNMAYMFNNCSSLIEANVSEFETGKVTNFQYLFRACGSIENLNVSKWDTKNVTVLFDIFSMCGNLRRLDVGNWDVSKVTNMQGIFYYCSKITSLDVTNWDTSNVTNMDGIFGHCSSLESIDVSKWNTKSATKMPNLFMDCSSLSSIDLSNFNTANLTSTPSSMFYNCSNLEIIHLGKHFDKLNGSGMFSNCNKLTAINTNKAITSSADAISLGENISLNSNVIFYVPDKTSEKAYESAENYETVFGTKDANGDIARIVTIGSDLVYATLYTDGTLGFSKDTTTISGKTVSKSYGNVNTAGYTTYTEVPWYNERMSITTVDFTNKVIPNNTAYWFYDCSNLTTINNISNLRTFFVTDMSYMFYNCCGLSNIDLSTLSTINVTNMSNIFDGCSNLITLDLSYLSTLTIKNINSMFANCNNLVELTFESNFNTRNVEDMNSMFYNCNNLKTLYLSENFDKLNGANMFYGCNKLIEITTDRKISSPDEAIILAADTGLEKLEDVVLYVQSLTSERAYESATNYEAVFGKKDETGDIERIRKMVDTQLYATLYDDGTLGFSSTEDKIAGKTVLLEYGDIINLGEFSNMTDVPWHSNSTLIKTVDFTNECVAYYSTAYWFYDCVYLTTINNISNLNTSNVKDMSYMFYNCYFLRSLDLSSFDTSNVKDMSYMFGDCNLLTSIDISSFDTSNVIDMSGMFYWCDSLTSPDLSSFDTSNVIDMSGMFYCCQSLTSIDLSGFNTSNVINMSDMFSSCYTLTSLNLSDFNTENVTDMSEMFMNCFSLTSLEVSGFNTSNVIDMYGMFWSCDSLTSLNLSGWNTGSVTTMDKMFANCESLTTIYIGSNWVTASNNSDMFNGCGTSTLTRK